MGSERKHWDLSQMFMLSHLLQDLDAINARQPYIQNNQVGSLQGNVSQRLFTAAEPRDFEFVTEKVIEQVAIVFHIFDDGDLVHGPSVTAIKVAQNRKTVCTEPYIRVQEL